MHHKECDKVMEQSLSGMVALHNNIRRMDS